MYKKSWNLKTFNQGYGMTFLLWRHNLIFDVNFDVKKYSFDICPLFTCQVSWQDIYYIYKSYAEIIKICDIFMTDFRAVWPRREDIRP